MKMDAIDAYKVYLGVKNHFTQDSYDWFKYNKKVNVTYDSFLKRKDKIFFAKLGNRKDAYLEEFLIFCTTQKCGSVNFCLKSVKNATKNGNVDKNL